MNRPLVRRALLWRMAIDRQVSVDLFRAALTLQFRHHDVHARDEIRRTRSLRPLLNNPEVEQVLDLTESPAPQNCSRCRGCRSTGTNAGTTRLGICEDFVDGFYLRLRPDRRC